MTDTKLTVGITGAGGFLGGALTSAFYARGARVVTLTRRPLKDPRFESRHYDLTSETPSLGIVEGVDVLIHGAYIRQAPGVDAFDLNTAGAERLFNVSRKNRARILFISSLSARAEAQSEYGRQKFAIERLLDHGSDTIVRPGLTLGNGGVFKNLYRHLRSNRFVPLLDGGGQPVQPAYIDDLVECIVAIVTKQLTGSYTIADRAGLSFRTFYRLLARMMNVRVKFIPVPFGFFAAALAFANAVKMNVPVDIDNVIGLRDAQLQPTTPYATFGVQPHSIEDGLRLAISALDSDGRAKLQISPGQR